MGLDVSVRAIKHYKKKSDNVIELIDWERVFDKEFKAFLKSLGGDNNEEISLTNKQIKELERFVYKCIIKDLEIYYSNWNTVFWLKYLTKSGYTIYITVDY